MQRVAALATAVLLACHAQPQAASTAPAAVIEARAAAHVGPAVDDWVIIYSITDTIDAGSPTPGTRQTRVTFSAATVTSGESGEWKGRSYETPTRTLPPLTADDEREIEALLPAVLAAGATNPRYSLRPGTFSGTETILVAAGGRSATFSFDGPVVTWMHTIDDQALPDELLSLLRIILRPR